MTDAGGAAGPAGAAPRDPVADRRALLAIGALTALAFVLRFAAARGDLWLDEIWSIYMAQGVRVDGVLALAHDNNHPLNTLWVGWLGLHRDPLLYRLPSVLAGGVATALAGAWGWSRGPWVATAAAGIFAVSLLSVQYGSEARGYGLALAATVGLALALERGATGPHWIVSALGFHLAVIGGLLAHLLVIPIFVAAFAWWFVAPAPGAGPVDRWRRGLVFFGPPALFLAWLYPRFIQGMGIGGGPTTDALQVASQACSLTLGLPIGPGVGALALTVVLVVGGAAWLWQRGDRSGVFLALASVGLPAALIAARQPTYVAPRYFLLNAAVAWLMMSAVLGSIAARGGRWRWAALGVLLASLLGNSARTATLLRDGRGHYLDAIALMARSAGPDETIRVGAENDFRVQLGLAYHGASSGSPRLRYASATQRTGDPPRFWIVDRFGLDAAPSASTLTVEGHRYALRQTFRSAPLSGATWHVYELIGAR